MKKLLLATAIAASAATGAHAATTYDVSSNVTGLQLWLGNLELLTSGDPAGYFTGVQFGGTAYDANDDGIIDSSNVTMVGEAGFTAGPQIKLTFNLGSGNYVHPVGTTFTSGTVVVDTYVNVNYGISETPDFQWVNFSTVDASTTNLPFLVGQPGHLAGGDPAYPNTTAGLLLAPGTNALPGLWDGQIPGAGINSAVSSLTLLGNTAGMFLDGTITLTAQAPAVPVPAAAWLFGSAMVGLAGVGRKRKTQA